MQPYPAYGDSGVEWLGKVPEHWRTVRAKRLFRKMDRPVRPDDEVVTCFRDGTVTLRRNRRELGFTESLKEIGYQGVRRGDLVIHAMDAFAGACGVADSDGKSTPVYAVCAPKDESANSRYYAFCVREMARSQWILALSRGVRERSTDFRFATFGNQWVPVPPSREQATIVRFLDHTDRRIRRYIRAKERLIELLEEQKQAIIHQAVTGQIDVRTGQPYPAYKDSGVEWLGEVPEHWCERPLKRVARIDNSGSYGEEPAGSECVLPVATTAQIDRDGQFSVGDMPQRGFSVKDAERYRCEVGDILVVKSSGSIFNVVSGKAGMVDEGCPEFAFSNFLLRVVADRRAIAPRLLFALLGGWLTRERVKRMVTGSTYPNLRVGEYVSALLPIPPRAEQSALIRFLDHATKKARAAISKTHQEIDLLLEYRTRLIADVVTGKLDVREVAAALPDSDTPVAEDTLQDTTEPDAELQPPHP